MLLPSGRSNSDGYPMQTTQKPQLFTRISSPQLATNSINKLENTIVIETTNRESATERIANIEACTNPSSPGSENDSNCSAHPHHFPRYSEQLRNTTVTVLSKAGNWKEIDRNLQVIQENLEKNWTVHVAQEGRLYYCNHDKHTASWLPSCEDWSKYEELPYGWERAIDSRGLSYYINHLNKTSTYEAPESVRWDQNPPKPRIVIIQRSVTLGFGFVAGSERPVIVRFVTDGGPSINKLQPGDQILAVNGEDVKEAPRDHVIQLVRACETQVTLLVCQPSHTLAPGRKSTLLSAGKRAKLRTRPSRVRFAESVCVNGSPLFPASAFSLGDICVPPMANVLKVFLENGQTKSFKYDATTTVQDVVGSLLDKLCLNTGEIFSLVLEHVKSLKRNKLTLLDPEESLARIAARPGAHKLRCLFRVTFVPKSAADLAQKDLNALDYLYMQCCNDVTQERFAPELQPEIALRLAALHMHQHALANNVSPAKLTVKVVEREFGLERFVPVSLFEGMKRKELRRLISHFLKLNGEMTGSSTKLLTQLQSKLHYLDIIASLPSYGAKCFSTNQREGVERVLLISPRFGLSQISSIRNSVPQPISAIEDINHAIVSRDDDVTCSVAIYMQGNKLIKFSMEDRDAYEFSLVLSGYYRLLTGKKLPVEQEKEQINEDNAPAYLAQHTVLPSAWSYLTPFHNRAHIINFIMMPPYHPLSIDVPMAATENHNRSEPNHTRNNQRERNITNSNIVESNQKPKRMPYVGNTAMDLDIHSVMATELLEEAKDSGMSDSSGGGSNYCDGSNCLNTTKFIEARNEEVLRRIHEMQKMVQNSEQYLNEQGELMPEYGVACRSGVNKSNFHDKINSKQNGNLNTDQNITKIGAVIEFDSDCDSINSSKVSSTEDTPQSGALKHSDSLVLLAEAINQDLNGITQGLNSIGGNHSGHTSISATCSPRGDRKFPSIGQLLSNLQMSSEFSQSESDSESVNSPTNSPTARRPLKVSSAEKRVCHNQNLAYRSSFGLHSPDGNNFGPDNKDYNLKEYLKQLKEISNIEDGTQDTDIAAKKLSEIHGFEIRGDTFIETDADLIDLRALPPPRTPDELDSISLLNAAPQGFDDGSKKLLVSDADSDLEKFLAKVVVAPPTQKATPAKELTPEEIMSFIIPPPPNLEGIENLKQQSNISQEPTESLYSNSMSDSRLFLNQTLEQTVTNMSSNQSTKANELGGGTHVIEYATVERRGKFSCCPKSTRDEENSDKTKRIELPPRSQYSDKPPPPTRPPKSAELIQRFSTKKQRGNTEIMQKIENNALKTINKLPEEHPPLLPPRISTSRRIETTCPTEMVSELPKKPPLPPMVNRPSSRDIHVNVTNSINEILSPIPPLTPPRLGPISSPTSICSNSLQSNNNSSPSPNGLHRSSTDYPLTFIQNPAIDKRSPISLLSSPQMSRKIHHSGPVAVPLNPNIVHKFGEKYIIKNGHVIDSEALLAKTDIAMAGLLVKLDQVAAQCSAAQLAGGGINIDEDKFQRARNELTEQTLVLVTASKFLVVAMSDMTLSTLPEHLTLCLTAIRRITELTQDMTRHTSSPLQTRNIVLKVHDVSSSFRELVGVKIGPLGAGQLALQAECLANVLATLLRSLRVFSP